jgi:hypothetical protein
MLSVWCRRRTKCQPYGRASSHPPTQMQVLVDAQHTGPAMKSLSQATATSDLAALWGQPAPAPTRITRLWYCVVACRACLQASTAPATSKVSSKSKLPQNAGSLPIKCKGSIRNLHYMSYCNSLNCAFVSHGQHSTCTVRSKNQCLGGGSYCRTCHPQQATTAYLAAGNSMHAQNASRRQHRAAHYA